MPDPGSGGVLPIQLDASDWIAIAAVLIAGLALIYAHKGYRNAQASLNLSREVADREMPVLRVSCRVVRASNSPAAYDVRLRLVNAGGGVLRVESGGFATAQDPLAPATRFRQIGPYSGPFMFGQPPFPIDLTASESEERGTDALQLVRTRANRESPLTYVFAVDSLGNRTWGEIPPDARTFLERIWRWPRTWEDDPVEKPGRSPKRPDLELLPQIPGREQTDPPWIDEP